MNWVTGLVLYIIIWWTALFAVLPVGTRPVAAADERSGWRGAPAHPHLARKVLATTIVAAIIWYGCYSVIHSDWISFRHGWLALPED